ncbi:MAG: ROK family protein [Ilumatobacteraceae bacterium]
MSSDRPDRATGEMAEAPGESTVPAPPSGGRRRPGSVPEGDVVLAVDIGSTKIAVGIVTMQGDLIDRDQFAVDHDLKSEQLWGVLREHVESQMVRARDHHNMRAVAVGVGSAGPITPNCETISPLNTQAWREFPLRERLTSVARLPVYGDLDAKALALAEGWIGAAQGHDNFIAMVVSTGVGGGIVLNGQLLDGAQGNAGHIGHVIVEPNGRRCGCGARGCLEAEASGTAIANITGRPASEPTYEIMQRTGRLVGTAVASVCNLLDLDLAVVGGSVALGFGATFFNSAQEALDECAKLAFSRGARITPVRLGDRGPLVGAGAVAIRGIHRARRAAATRAPGVEMG